MNQLMGFYLGSHHDHKGRMLAEILKQDDFWFEHTHDFIQWIFPLNELSRASLHAPLVDGATRHAFHTDPLFASHMRMCVARMVRFLGLKFDGQTLSKAANWDERKKDWFTEHTHNSLRITRMLKSMSFLGLAEDAKRLQKGFERLCAQEPDCGITGESRQIWSASVH